MDRDGSSYTLGTDDRRHALVAVARPAPRLERRAMVTPGDPVSRPFAVLVGTLALYGVVLGAVLLFVQPVANGRALLALTYGSLVAALGLWARRRCATPASRALFGFVLGLSVPLYYGLTGTAIHHLALPLQDDALRNLDAMLLGWLVPDGQITVWLDGNAYLGPHTPLGRVLTELLQLAYLSFFLWEFGLLFILMHRVRKGTDGHAWTHLRRWLCAWLGAYVVLYAFYVLVPALGPFIVRPDTWTHGLEGLGLTQPIRELILGFQVTPDCFPSGHVALSWITAVFALRYAPRWGRASLVAAVLITISTIVLRYHYVIDVLAAVPLVLFGLLWGGWPARAENRPARVPARVREAAVT